MVGTLIGKGLCHLGVHGVDYWTYCQSSQALTLNQPKFMLYPGADYV